MLKNKIKKASNYKFPTKKRREKYKPNNPQLDPLSITNSVSIINYSIDDFFL